jgi:hypothetical protein
LQTHWYYERARGQFLNDQSTLTSAQKAQFLRMNPKAQVITKTDLAKIETCFDGEPDTSCRGAEKAFLLFAKRVTDDWRKDNRRAEFTDDWFKTAVAKTIVFRATEKVVSGADWYEGGYRAQVVAYICARLVRLAQDASDGGRLNYLRIWSAQAPDDVFLEQIDRIGAAMMDVLRNPPREGQNITEWAKQQACREAAVKRAVECVDGFEKWIVGADVDRSERRDSQAAGEVDEDLRVITQVMAVQPQEWISLREELRRRKMLASQDVASLRAACGESGRPPNEIQAKRLVQILQRAEDVGLR